MRKYVPFLLLAAAIGCSETGGPAPTTESVSIESATTEVATTTESSGMTLPDATATTVKFTCPGMT